MRKLIFLFTALLLSTGGLHAKNEITFVSEAPEAVVVGKQFKLIYTVTTQSVKDFRAPTIKDFDVLMGPSRSQQSSTQIINGSITSNSSVTFTYILMASSVGDFSIPGATITADGKQMLSNSVNVKVLPEDKAANAGGGEGSSSSNSVSGQELFVTATVNKTTVYEQEAFLLTFKIYTLVDVSFNNVKLPDFKGFHSQEVELPQTHRWQLEHHNGRNYNTTVYRQFVLFPQQGGQLVIEPARFEAVVSKAVRSADPFDAFFNGGRNVVEVKKPLLSPKLTINVNALPAGKPAGFSGGVGDFSITSSINSTDVKTNDAITLKLVVSGTGNLRLTSAPEAAFPTDFETYDPKTDNKIRLTTTGHTGSKVIEYLAIPRHPGTFKIPALSFSYFDLKSQSYKTLKTEEYTVNVQKGEGNSDQTIANFTNKEELKVLGEDVRFIKLNDVKLHPKGQFFFGSTGYWMFYIILTLAFVVFFIVYRKRAIESTNIVKMRTKKANKIATGRLKLAGKLLAENKKEAFYDEVLKALWGYTGDKLNIPVSLLTKDNIEDKLKERGVDGELIKAFLDVLHECEFARFAPGTDDRAMENVYSSALEVIGKMENGIKNK